MPWPWEAFGSIWSTAVHFLVCWWSYGKRSRVHITQENRRCSWLKSYLIWQMLSKAFGYKVYLMDNISDDNIS